MAEHDVAVVGGGPVGLLLACLLARHGVSVGVYEKRSAAPSGTRAIGIHPPGLAALRAAGIAAAVREEAVSVARGSAWSEGEMLATLPLDDGPVLALPQWRIETLLRERLAALAPEALRLGARVEGVREEGEGMVVSLSGRREVRARLVVAADGVRSGIRSDGGIGWQRRRGHGRYAMADVDDTTDLGPDAHLFCEPGGIVESFPLPGRRRRWVALLGPTTGEPALAELVTARTGHGPDIPDDAVSAFLARQHRASVLVRGRLLLVGDAAHEVSPIGGQGMNLGWIGAVRLAQAVPRALGGDRRGLHRYERMQQRSARRARRRARFNMAMGRPVRAPLRLARRLVIQGMGRKPFRAFVRRMFTMQRL